MLHASSDRRPEALRRSSSSAAIESSSRSLVQSAKSSECALPLNVFKQLSSSSSGCVLHFVELCTARRAMWIIESVARSPIFGREHMFADFDFRHLPRRLRRHVPTPTSSHLIQHALIHITQQLKVIEQSMICMSGRYLSNKMTRNATTMPPKQQGKECTEQVQSRSTLKPLS